MGDMARAEFFGRGEEGWVQSGASSAVIAHVVAESTRGDEGDNDGSWRQGLPSIISGEFPGSGNSKTNMRIMHELVASNGEDDDQRKVR